MMKKVALSALLALGLMAESEHDALLSSLKKQQFQLDYEKAKEDASALRYDWVNQITGSYTQTHNRDYDPNQKTKTYSVSINQPVFKSGGIYYGIKYADATEKYQYGSIKVEEKTQIKTVINLMYSLRRVDLEIEKQKLLIENTKIDVERKKEQFQSGFLDSGTLDNAILDRSQAESSLLSLESSRSDLLKSLKDISDKSYETLELPQFHLMEKEQFIDKNINLRVARDYTEQQEYRKKGIITTYFPTLSLTAAYYDTEYENSSSNSDDGNSYSTVGFTLSMPLLDVNMYNNIQSYRIDHLKAAIAESETKREEQNRYENILEALNIIDKRIGLSQSDMEQYDSLVMEAREKYTAGEKTVFDVETLENSRDIRKLDLSIYAIDKQLQLLELYANMEQTPS